jgi:hypothetical protein
MAVMYRHFLGLQAVENEGRSRLCFDLPCAEKSRMDLFSASLACRAQILALDFDDVGQDMARAALERDLRAVNRRQAQGA